MSIGYRAAGGNRTRIQSLGSFCVATTPQPQTPNWESSIVTKPVNIGAKMQNSKGQHLCDSACWRVDTDEDTGKKFWRGAGAGDKDESRFNAEEPLIMRPEHFADGCVVKVYEPE